MEFLNPYMFWIKIAGYILLATAIAYTSYWATSTVYENRILKIQNEYGRAIIVAVKAASNQQAAADKITYDRDVANAKAHQHIEYVHDVITRKVPYYVSVETDHNFPLPCGFARLHNAFASSTDPASIPLPPGVLDTDRCDVATSTAIQIIGDNYKLALGWQADLQTDKQWHVDQEVAWNKYRASVLSSDGGAAAPVGR